MLQEVNTGKMAKLSLKEKRAHLLRKLDEKKRAQRKAAQSTALGGGDGEDWEDVDEHEKEVFATTGFFDV